MDSSIAPAEDPASNSKLYNDLNQVDFVDVRRTAIGNRVQIHAHLKEEEQLGVSDRGESGEGKSIGSDNPMAASVKEEPLELLPEDTEMRSAEELHCEQSGGQVKQERAEECDVKTEESCGKDRKPFGYAIAAVPLTVVPAEQARDAEMESEEMVEAAEILAGGIQPAKEVPVEPETVAKEEQPEVSESIRAEMDEKEGVAADRMATEKAADKLFPEETNPKKEPEKTVILIDEMPDGNPKEKPVAPPPPKPLGPRMVDGRPVEDGDFPEEDDWYLVGRTMVTGVSTSKGRKLVDNEIVYFKFSKLSSKSNAQWIVRFSTKRSGEVGRLPMEWGKCVVPVVSSGKVKVLGRCVAAPPTLHIMQEVFIYVSFYIHRSIFIALESSTWSLESNTYVDPQTYPLLSLFKLLNLKPFQKAEFTPSEIESRKRGLKLEEDSDASVLHLVKKRKGGVQAADEDKDEQAFCESTLNKIVGTADVYDLKEMEAPQTLTCHLKPYQKEALNWMCGSEVGMNDEETARMLHPCWAAYNICDERTTSIYLNIFSGEATTQFPAAAQITKGGILADAMGLGKTVMTISLLLARPSRGSPVWQNEAPSRSRGRGGTLIVCPMALLHQWKDELETHAKPGSLSVFVHYGGERMQNSMLISGYDVILTTFGVLMTAYKQEGQNSIFHSVDWFRVVLDEAHTIKNWKSLGAQATFKLNSHYRWCLTGTPLQNNLEDIYSLLCFLHVQPWCNWAWWNKLIHRPYENGDPRALKLMKAILRPLMLRRTKETKDKYGRPILVLPPTDIQLVKCEPSEAERDFYVALFRRSKDEFENLVAQGTVLNNYASVLELLLRLRQCCNHPYLVTSKYDINKYWDLHKLSKRFFQESDDSMSETTASSQACTEVTAVEGQGKQPECPICLESADDPVFTPCKHRMCRECLLASWRTHTGGPCPLCRAQVTQSSLISCPSGTKFTINLQKKWKASSKITMLLECLERIDRYSFGEKSIVFSQWTTFLDLLEIPLREQNIEFLRFDGKLSQKNREKVLKEFNETGHKRVLLMSLRAGGVGLNLTAASNVFIMDPWWNPAVEEQAIMRIHRIGQKRTVKVRRFIVSDTVEERLLQVQAKKEKMIAGALTDDDVRSARIEELKMLFR
ncbi:DNA repair protein RAD5B [Linum grandiflorum]